ncbi:MAG: DUF1573 domain-containing protein [Saprospiraceae bacterium]|nr:DUF1573 domain-containing protein [Saprospiraceae bacterium]
MKKLLSVLVFVFAIAAVASAQADKAPAATEKSTGPAVKFEKYTIDYGTVEYNSDPFRTFKFTNVGTEPLVIKSARSSCGCTVPEWPKEPIPPGATGELKVRYATDRPGGINKSITVTTNAEPADVVLNITGTVKPKAAEAPAVPEGQSNMFKSNN